MDGHHWLKFRQLLGELDAGDVVVADELYCSYWILATLKARGVDALMHQSVHRAYDFRRGKRLGPGDHIVKWARPPRPSWMDHETYAAMPEPSACVKCGSTAACW